MVGGGMGTVGVTSTSTSSNIFLQNVKVLATDQVTGVTIEKATVMARAVTLEVTAEDAQKVLIAEKVGKFWPQDVRTKYDVVQWVIWQMANQGPKLGEAGHFRRLGDREGDQKYAVNRFTDEANRLYGVLNNRLADRPWLAGKLDAGLLRDGLAGSRCEPLLQRRRRPSGAAEANRLRSSRG